METQTTFLNVTKGGRTWIPRFVLAIDQERCIGCGRCYKVCGRAVMTLMGMNEDGDLVPMDDGEDEEIEKKVMVLGHPENCIGCEACSRVCPKKCYVHAPVMEPVER